MTQNVDTTAQLFTTLTSKTDRQLNQFLTVQELYFGGPTPLAHEKSFFTCARQAAKIGYLSTSLIFQESMLNAISVIKNTCLYHK